MADQFSAHSTPAQVFSMSTGQQHQERIAAQHQVMYDSAIDNAGLFNTLSTRYPPHMPVNALGFSNINNASDATTYPAVSPPYAQSEEYIEAAGLIPVEFDFRYTKDYHSKGVHGANLSGYSNLRRRAQNRASQRAFRTRKKERMAQLKHQVEELQTQHEELTKSYESLRFECSRIKREVDELRDDNARLNELSSSSKKMEALQREIPDSVIFGASEPDFDTEKRFTEKTYPPWKF